MCTRLWPLLDVEDKLGEAVQSDIEVLIVHATTLEVCSSARVA